MVARLRYSEHEMHKSLQHSFQIRRRPALGIKSVAKGDLLSALAVLPTYVFASPLSLAVHGLPVC